MFLWACFNLDPEIRLFLESCSQRLDPKLCPSPVENPHMYSSLTCFINWLFLALTFISMRVIYNSCTNVQFKQVWNLVCGIVNFFALNVVMHQKFIIPLHNTYRLTVISEWKMRKWSHGLKDAYKYAQWVMLCKIQYWGRQSCWVCTKKFTKFGNS